MWEEIGSRAQTVELALDKATKSENVIKSPARVDKLNLKIYMGFVLLCNS